jgi:hypothetical protein
MVLILAGRPIAGLLLMFGFTNTVRNFEQHVSAVEPVGGCDAI